MSTTLRAVLDSIGIDLFGGAALDSEVFSDHELWVRYNNAFRGSGSTHRVVVVDGRGDGFLLDSLEQLCEKKDFFAERCGIEMILRIPFRIWTKGDVKVQGGIKDFRAT